MSAGSPAACELADPPSGSGPVRPLAWALGYARHGLSILPVKADKTPLTEHGYQDASTDPDVIAAWWRRYPNADPAWALPPTVVVADIDVKGGKRGFQDFERLSGEDARDVVTPATSTPSGGLHLFFAAAARPYRNRVAIRGTAIDTRSQGGYIILPARNNGRQWLRRLRDTPMAPAPAWLDFEPTTAFTPAAITDTRAPGPLPRNDALMKLQHACARILGAANGLQDATRHAQCFFIGRLVGRGDLDYGTAYSALLAAVRAMPMYGKPWRDLDKRVDASIRRGMEQAP